MQFIPPLIEATLIKRYKRFLADVTFTGGEQGTVYCPNTGSMLNCAEPGRRIWLSRSDDPKRKYQYTWQLIEPEPSQFACIHSALANQLVREGIEQGVVRELAGYDSLQTEVRYGQEKSRIDFLLASGAQRCYVEVKSVTLHVGQGLGLFPDAVSARGAKHLRELIEMKRSGCRAVLFFCVQHTGIERVAPAHRIDREYGETLRKAVAAGVEVFAYSVDINPSAMQITKALPFDIDAVPGN